jgi:restriction system protein
MPIPDYQSVMLPLLRIAADGKEHHIRDAIDMLAKQFGVTEDERKELVPSGFDRVFDNRVGWARTYLKKAGLIDYPRRGYFKATDRGTKVISQNVPKVDVPFLNQYPEFVEFHTAKKPASNSGTTEKETRKHPPRPQRRHLQPDTKIFESKSSRTCWHA